MDHKYFNSYMESNRTFLKENYLAIQKHIGENVKVIPVLKDDGYGFGDIEAARCMIEVGAEILAVAQVCEGMRMRDAGINVPILVLGGNPVHTLPYAVKYGLQTIVFTKENAEQLNSEAKKQGKIAEVHIKLDTGMHRVGVQVGKPLADFMEIVKSLKNLKVVGAFTHFATSDNYNDPFTLEQLEKFRQGIRQILADGSFDLKYIHCRNSCGTIWVKDEYSTHVRPAALLLGYGRMGDGSTPVPVKETLSLRSFITMIKEVPVGETVGYGRFFKPEKPTMVATVSLGYGDGLFRPLAMACHGPVLVNDTLCHYVGLCMDQLFIDVTGVDCKVGDEITVFGYSRNGTFLSAYDVAAACGTSFHTLITSPTRRVGREFVD